MSDFDPDYWGRAIRQNARLQEKTLTETYYGIKKVLAWPEERALVSGYAVQYQDGYISWSPKATFEKAYQPIDKMSFSCALQAMKDGSAIARRSWGNTDSVGFLTCDTSGNIVRHYPSTGGAIPAMVTFFDTIDIMADDWMVVGVIYA